MIQEVNMRNIYISFMEQNDIQKSAEVLSIAMLDNPLHMAVLKGNGDANDWKSKRCSSNFEHLKVEFSEPIPIFI